MRALLVISIFVSSCYNPIKPPTFITKHGIQVYNGIYNKSNNKEIEEWTEETISFWLAFGLEEDCLRTEIEYVTVMLMDAEYFTEYYHGHVVVSTGYNGTILIGNVKDQYVKKLLYFYELSRYLSIGCLPYDLYDKLLTYNLIVR